jgi:hypothetical protein
MNAKCPNCGTSFGLALPARFAICPICSHEFRLRWWRSQWWRTRPKVTLPDQNSRALRLLGLEIPEARYKADMAMHDSSQALASELLKLALGGIAVVGFLLTKLPAALLQRFYGAGAMFLM